MLRHFQRGMSQQPLKSKSIATTVYQILSGKSVSKKVGACFLNPTRLVISGNGVSQRVSPKLVSILGTKQVITWATPTSCEILSHNRNQHRTQGNRLHLAIFRMAKDDLSILQVYILDLDTTNGGSTTTIIQQEVDDYPCSVLIKGAILIWLLQKEHKLFI